MKTKKESSVECWTYNRMIILKTSPYYCYDDHNRVFKTVGLEKRMFQKRDYSYKFFEDTLPVMQKDSMQFQYPICAFKLREDYCADGCAFEAFRKIRAEVYGERLIKESLKAEGTYEQTATIYRGISCLDALSCYIEEILESKSSDGGLVKKVKILCEHRKMMLVSMKYLQRKWSKAMNSQVITESINGYKECCLAVEKWVNMSIKYELTRNQELLSKIIEEIPEVIKNEYGSLNQLVNYCIEWKQFNFNFT